MRKIICPILCIAMLLSLCACGSSKDNDFIDSFIEYHSESKDLNDSGFMLITEESGITFMSLQKEEDSAYPKVVLEIHMLATYIDEYNWMTSSPDVRKSEMKDYGEMVIEYAKDKGWKNNYYLYVVMSYGYSNNVVYDYETDTIWIPDREPIFIEMYEQFSTLSCSDLEETEEGRDFLVDNGLATIKHNELEGNYYDDGGYDVCITSEGEFKTFGKNESTAY